MSRLWKICFIISIFTFQIVLSMNKYSKEANVNQFTQNDKPFRMQKLNLLWQQAMKKFNQKELLQLMQDLKHQDAIEIELKKIKADNNNDGDLTGEKTLQVQKQLRMILNKYGLTDDATTTSKQTSSTDDDHGGHFKSQIFSNEKIEKLWNKISELELNEYEQTILKDELKNFQNKLTNYHRLIDKYHEKLSTPSIDDENISNNNFIDPLYNPNTNAKQLNEEMDQKIQQKHLEIKQDYKRLNSMINDRNMIYKMNNDKTMMNEFDEENVRKLWQLALKTDFNPSELEELKEKLLHYQNRLKKLNYFENQLEKHRTQNNDNQLSSESEMFQKHAENRVRELNGHVKKLHRHLEEQILLKHSEL